MNSPYIRSIIRMLHAAATVAALVVFAGGCGGDAIGPAAPPSRVDYFIATQEATETPHGRIVMDSVEDIGSGVRYRTDDGSVHEVDLAPQPDGSYRISNHRRLHDVPLGRQ